VVDMIATGDALVAAGHLQPDEREDRAKLKESLEKFLASWSGSGPEEE
jgi:hypothetical protein